MRRGGGAAASSPIWFDTRSRVSGGLAMHHTDSPTRLFLLRWERSELHDHFPLMRLSVPFALIAPAILSACASVVVPAESSDVIQTGDGFSNTDSSADILLVQDGRSGDGDDDGPRPVDGSGDWICDSLVLMTCPTRIQAFLYTPISLSVQAGTDAGGDLAFRWSVVPSPSGSRASPTPSDVQQPEFVPDATDRYELRVLATDRCDSVGGCDIVVDAVR